MRARTLAASLLSLCLLVACANPQREKLDRGMAFARRQFVEATRNPLAATALGSNMEMGGTLATYLAANMPEHADLPRFQDDRAAEPWSVALRAVGTDTILIEGFGDALDRPLKVDTVVMRPSHGP
jgi:hypothetical protein